MAHRHIAPALQTASPGGFRLLYRIHIYIYLYLFIYIFIYLYIYSIDIEIYLHPVYDHDISTTLVTMVNPDGFVLIIAGKSPRQIGGKSIQIIHWEIFQPYN